MKIDVPILGFGRAGGYRVISQLASQWKRMGHDVRILSNCASAAPYFATEAEIVWLDDSGIRVEKNAEERLSCRRGVLGVARNLLSLLGGMNRYSVSTDVIVANHSLTAWPVWASAARGKKVYYVQGYEAEFYAKSAEGRRLLLEAQAWLSYYLPLRRIVNAPVYLKYRNLRAKFWVPPGIDFAVFSAKEPHFRNEETGFSMGCIGRREPEKGTQYVIEAHELLRKWGKNVRLKIAYGNIPDHCRNVQGVEIVVPRNDQELAEFYRSTDVFVAPALGQHGAPHYPVMEAMACGVPLITTGYLPASAENSWLVPERDPVSIANSVLDIASCGSRRAVRLGCAARAISAFGWETVAAQMLETFNL